LILVLNALVLVFEGSIDPLNEKDALSPGTPGVVPPLGFVFVDLVLVFCGAELAAGFGELLAETPDSLIQGGFEVVYEFLL
jgi:hypothetical protein